MVKEGTWDLNLICTGCYCWGGKKCTMWEFQVQLNLGKNKDWSPEDSISDGSEKLLLEDKGGARLYRSFATNGRSSEYQLVLLSKETRYVSLRSLALFFVQEDARVWVYWNHSFDLHLSYLGPVSWVFISWVSSRCNVGSGYRLMIARWQIFFLAWFPSGLTSSPSMIGCNHWWLWDPCLLLWQAIFHFSLSIP